ncbi:DMT family transporter [uncultured Dialister sp.]|uniref:DMT family transporter n=1 Tax=uncultured Dialister sp. TaxID=278064 RepID=UPI00261EB367|nr:DMT family transporter [uncultured Dialister sp.]
MSQNKADFLLFTAAFVWGSSYGLMKLGAETMPPICLAALRCLFAFFILIPFFPRRLKKTDKAILKYSAVTGFLIAGVFIGVIYGVIGTSASTAGFLISTSVIMVPILHGLWIRKMPSLPIMTGTAIVTAGLFILNGVTSITLDKGFVLCLLAAFLYALDILFTNTFVSKVDSLLLGIWQMGFAGLFAGMASLFLETPVMPSTLPEWTAILGLAIFSSAYGFTIQAVAQEYTTPERAGFIFSLEPVFAAVFACLFLGENMGKGELTGAALILLGVWAAGGTLPLRGWKRGR